MLRRFPASVPVTGTIVCAVRHMLEDRTKGSPFMKHLDLYARRDPQLAPFLLREVDIEFKRKCRKVSFCAWVAVLTVLLAYQYRLQAEELFYVKHYAEYWRAEQDARDEDNLVRRRAFVSITNVVKNSFNRDQKWNADDASQCNMILREK